MELNVFMVYDFRCQIIDLASKFWRKYIGQCCEEDPPYRIRSTNPLRDHYWNDPIRLDLILVEGRPDRGHHGPQPRSLG
jgi:hypothetical protein